MKKTLIMVALIAVAISANAQRRYDRPMPPYQAERHDGFSRDGFAIDEMQREAKMRIQWGSDKGAITPREARQLWGQLHFVEQKKYHFERDGMLSNFERDELVSDLRNLHQRIGREIHDGDRYSRYDGPWRRN